MDNNISPNVTSQIPAQIQRVPSITPGSGQAVQQGKTGSSAHVPESAQKLIDNQLFALEKFVPVQILQNPQLLKAEWAWKVFIMQQLALHGVFDTSTSSPEVTTQGSPLPNSSPDTSSSGSSSRDAASLGHPSQDVPSSGLLSPDARTSGASSSGIQTVSQGQNHPSEPLPQSQSHESFQPLSPVVQAPDTGKGIQPSPPRTVSMSESVSTTADNLVSRTTSSGNGEAASNQFQPLTSPSSSQTTRPTSVAANSTPAGKTNRLQPLAQAVVQQLWNALTTISRQSQTSPNHAYVSQRTDSPILPFASMNQDTIQLGQTPTDQHRLSTWVLEDRMVSSVLDNPYEQIGGGLFFPPATEESTPPHHAVKWNAHRQTRMGAGGKLVHRIRFEIDVKGHAVTCILTAQRPQLLVHFVSDHVKLRSYLEHGMQIVGEPLRQYGWDLVSWTAGEPSNA